MIDQMQTHVMIPAQGTQEGAIINLFVIVGCGLLQSFTRNFFGLTRTRPSTKYQHLQSCTICCMCTKLLGYKNSAKHIMLFTTRTEGQIFFFVLLLFKTTAGLAPTQKQLWGLYNMKEVLVVSQQPCRYVTFLHFFLTEVNPASIKQTSIRYIVARDTSLQRKHRNLKAPCITPAKTEKKQEHPEDRRPLTCYKQANDLRKLKR